MANLLEQYKDEPRLGDARALGVRRGWERAAAALGAYRRERKQFEAATLGAGVGDAGRVSETRSGAAIGVAAVVAAAVAAVAEGASDGMVAGTNAVTTGEAEVVSARGSEGIVSTCGEGE